MYHNNNKMEKYIPISEDVFYEKYTPIQNHLDENAAFDGNLFETYGAEIQFVLNYDRKKVWTILEAENNIYIAAGYHLVNRLGYFITDIEWTDETEEYQFEGFEDEE